MIPGAVAHQWYGHKVLLILRDKHRPGDTFAYPNCWDPVSETPEPEDEGDLRKTMRRGNKEELGIEPRFCIPIGLTRQNRNLLHVGFLTREEVGAIVLGPEGQKWGLFTLEKVWKLYHANRLGGGIKFHLEAYPEAFEKMAAGLVPTRQDLRLYEFEVPLVGAK
jgi:hypothetical protein